MEQILETFYKVVDDAANGAVAASASKIWNMVPPIKKEMNRLAFE
jgi:hypothetical protein